MFSPCRPMKRERSQPQLAAEPTPPPRRKGGKKQDPGNKYKQQQPLQMDVTIFYLPVVDLKVLPPHKMNEGSIAFTLSCAQTQNLRPFSQFGSLIRSPLLIIFTIRPLAVTARCFIFHGLTTNVNRRIHNQ